MGWPFSTLLREFHQCYWNYLFACILYHFQRVRCPFLIRYPSQNPKFLSRYAGTFMVEPVRKAKDFHAKEVITLYWLVEEIIVHILTGILFPQTPIVAVKLLMHHNQRLMSNHADSVFLFLSRLKTMRSFCKFLLNQVSLRM